MQNNTTTIENPIFLGTTAKSTLNLISSFFLTNINPYLISYFEIILITTSLINNTIVIIIFNTSNDVNSRITKSIRVYYSAIAAGDISETIALHLTYFLGSSRCYFIINNF